MNKIIRPTYIYVKFLRLQHRWFIMQSKVWRDRLLCGLRDCFRYERGMEHSLFVLWIFLLRLAVA